MLSIVNGVHVVVDVVAVRVVMIGDFVVVDNSFVRDFGVSPKVERTKVE